MAPTIRKDYVLTNPQSLVISKFNFLFSFEIQATSKARGLRLYRMVRVGLIRQSFPLPGKPSLEPCLSFTGRSRAEPYRRA